MTTHAPAPRASAALVAPVRSAAGDAALRRIHLLLAAQTAIVVLLSINRLSSWTTGVVEAAGSLRWVDLHNMLTLPLLSLTAFYALKRLLETQSGYESHAARTRIGFIFLFSVYLFGAGYGAHEVTNSLHVRFCAPEPQDALCAIIASVDDGFSHWVWFAGFVGINAALLLLQATTRPTPYLGGGDRLLLIVNGLCIAAGIVANLAFEAIGLDLYVVTMVALLAGALLVRQGARPLHLYYATAYGVGLLATGAIKLLV